MENARFVAIQAGGRRGWGLIPVGQLSLMQSLSLTVKEAIRSKLEINVGSGELVFAALFGYLFLYAYPYGPFSLFSAAPRLCVKNDKVYNQ